MDVARGLLAVNLRHSVLLLFPEETTEVKPPCRGTRAVVYGYICTQPYF